MKTIRRRFSSVVHSLFCLSLLIGIPFLVLSCTFPIGTDSSNSKSTENIDEYATPDVEVQFSVQLPSSLPENVKIVLEVLDEVTGLPYNTRLYDMTESGELKYSTALSFPQGSIIKYRYVKIGSTMTPEVVSDGQPVRYRLFYVKSSDSAVDILQCWQNEAVNAAVGSLSGVVLNDETGEPIPDILVSTGGQLTFSDANGTFLVENLSPGVHNIVFYAMDGSYRTFQQGAVISAGATTPAVVNLTPLALVNITFNVTAPVDALGAPIYLAGNVLQLGNTFSDLAGRVSIDPKRMPTLKAQDDGTYSVSLNLYTETDLRYKLTLGDGYWNAEQRSTGGFRVRQLIVPDKDISLNLSIESWRTSGIEPITFEVLIPAEISPNDEKFIQFRTVEWTQPIPLWPLGGGNYLYILFSPLDISLPVFYQFCRNENYKSARNADAVDSEVQVQPSETAQTVSVLISGWENWQVLDQPTEIIAANIPVKGYDFLTSVELTSQMDTTWRVYAPIGISKVAEIQAENVIFSPQWFIQPNSNTLSPELGKTPFDQNLSALVATSHSLGLSTSLFPQVGCASEMENGGVSQVYDKAWWQDWFVSYERFILNYAKFAEENNVAHLIISGKDVLPRFSNCEFPDVTETDVTALSSDRWNTLIGSIRMVYSGSLVWATNAHTDLDPLPEFIALFDEIYISIDSPLSLDTDATLEEISANFIDLIDTYIYEIYRITQKPITLALAYPSVDGSAMGCSLLNDSCANDGVFLPDETSSIAIDLEEQVHIYNAVLPIVASRDWVTGISIRGYNPIVDLQDGSSSLSGKPALDVIWYWFSGLNKK